MFGIEEPLAALNFDRAVYYFGSVVEGEMQEAANKAKTSKAAKAKAQQVLDKWLADPEAPGRFRDPASASA